MVLLLWRIVVDASGQLATGLLLQVLWRRLLVHDDGLRSVLGLAHIHVLAGVGFLRGPAAEREAGRAAGREKEAQEPGHEAAARAAFVANHGRRGVARLEAARRLIFWVPALVGELVAEPHDPENAQDGGDVDGCALLGVREIDARSIVA